MSFFKPYDKKSDYSFSVGVYPTLELMKQMPDKVLEIVYEKEGLHNKGLVEILSIAKKKNITSSLNPQLVGKIAKRDKAYVVASFRKTLPKLNANENHIVLVNPSDMGNLGTIIRTMVSYNFNNLAIIKPSADIFDPKTVRSSMGSIFQLHFEYFQSIREYMKVNRNKMYSFTTNSGNTLSLATFNEPFALVFGGEGPGLQKEDVVGTEVSIEQTGRTDSLNLSVAVGIVLHKAFTDSSYKHQ